MQTAVFYWGVVIAIEGGGEVGTNHWEGIKPSELSLSNTSLNCLVHGH